MNPIGASERHGHYFDYGSISHNTELPKPEQGVDARARRMFEAAGDLANRCLVQIVKGLKPRVMETEVEAPGDTDNSVKLESVKKPGGRPLGDFSASLKAVEHSLLDGKLPVEKAVSRFLEEVDELDMDDHEILLAQLSAMPPDRNAVRQGFRAQVISTLKAGVAANMDVYAILSLERIARVCGIDPISMSEVAEHVHGFLWARSKLLERHPEIASESALKLDHKIQRWFSKQTPELRKDVMHTVGLIAKMPDSADDYPATIRLRAFCQRVQAAHPIDYAH